MSRFHHHFTLSEANSLLPWIQSIFIEVHMIMGELATQSAGPPEALAEGNGHATNGHQKHSAQTETGVSKLGLIGHQPPWAGLTRDEKLALVNHLLRALVDKGIVLQDIERGLIDFPAWRHGEEVLLCYELSDGPAVGFWHDLDAGFAGRQPIEDEDWPD